MLRRILAAIASAINAAFWLADQLVDGFLIAAKLKPSLPPVDASADLNEIAASKREVERLEDVATVKNWATARLYGKKFELPDRPISQWLTALTVDDAARVAVADGAGELRDHLDGGRQAPGLPPVGSFEDTRRWRSRNMPRPPRRTDNAAFTDVLDPGTPDIPDWQSVLEYAGG
jgi:hypothetical protein